MLDDAATEMIRSVKEALADNRLAGLPTPSWSLPEETVARREEKYGKQDATENKENNHERNNE